eukprot:181432-Hanusia_phi.AAC.1
MMIADDSSGPDSVTEARPGTPSPTWPAPRPPSGLAAARRSQLPGPGPESRTRPAVRARGAGVRSDCGPPGSRIRGSDYRAANTAAARDGGGGRAGLATLAGSGDAVGPGDQYCHGAVTRSDQACIRLPSQSGLNVTRDTRSGGGVSLTRTGTSRFGP